MRPGDDQGGRAWIELDLGALRHNVAALRALLPPGCALMPAVKANAYGHGALPVTGELERLGVGAFCVASAEEGAELRRGGVKGELLVLGYTPEDRLEMLEEYRLIQAVADEDYALLLSARGRGTRVHLAVDTGMHRLGLDAGDPDALERVRRLKGLRVEGAFTHLCTPERRFCRLQAWRFWAAVRELGRRGCPVGKVHLLSSAGLLRYPELGGDYARVGIALYGLGSTPEDTDPRLRPVLSLKARVASVRDVKKGEGAGYDLRYTAPEDARLAVLSIGYADGLPRSLSCGRGRVLLRGEAAPIAGMICMDQTLVDITHIPEVRPGDEAVLIGASGARTLTAADQAQAAGTISNELVSRLGPRLERVVI